MGIFNEIDDAKIAIHETTILALVKKPPGSWQDPAKNPDPRRDPAGIMPARVFSRQDPVRKKIPP